MMELKNFPCEPHMTAFTTMVAAVFQVSVQIVLT